MSLQTTVKKDTRCKRAPALGDDNSKYLPAIYVAYIGAKENRLQMIKAAVNTTNFLGVSSSIKVLFTKGSGKLLRIVAAVEIGNVSINQAIQTPSIHARLAATPEGQKFLEIWPIISAATDITTLGVNYLASIVKNGPKVSKILKDNGHKEASEKLDDIVEEASKASDEIVEATPNSGQKITKYGDDFEIPSIKNNAFQNWFNKLSPDEFDLIWANPILKEKIMARLRYPGGKHEWLLVSRANVFKRWGVKFEQIEEYRTTIEKVKFINKPGYHGGPGSGSAHDELIKIIDNSVSFEDYRRKLSNWANYRLEGGVEALPKGLQWINN